MNRAARRAVLRAIRQIARNRQILLHHQMAQPDCLQSPDGAAGCWCITNRFAALVAEEVGD